MTSTDQTEFAEWLDLNDTHVIAGELNRSTRDARIYSFRHMPKDKAIRVMALLEPVNQRDILMALGTGDRKDVLEGMEPDDRGRLFSQLPREQRTRLLEELSAEERRLTLEVLRHPEHSAGRIMTPEFVRLVPEMSAGEALEAVRSGAGRAETVYLMPVAG